MISWLIYSKYHDEFILIRDVIKRNIPFVYDTNLRIHDYSKLFEINNSKVIEEYLDVLCFDVSNEKGRIYAESVRRKCESAEMLVIVDEDTDAQCYVNPYIRPTSLMIRPLYDAGIRNKMIEVCDSCLKKNIERDDTVWIMDTFHEIPIPVHIIDYIEVFNKKIHIITQDNEYSYYGALNKIMEKYPERFLRCNRSCIVNVDKIDFINVTKSKLYLVSGKEVDVSRRIMKDLRYKSITVVKEGENGTEKTSNDNRAD
ncbi:MAG: LytTR family transcriptional regulator [Lachnospiraceae bacterium]|nr:LytTR family transcriptional regulator [Lachnospiraceae bacterium]